MITYDTNDTIQFKGKWVAHSRILYPEKKSFFVLRGRDWDGYRRTQRVPWKSVKIDRVGIVKQPPRKPRKFHQKYTLPSKLKFETPPDHKFYGWDSSGTFNHKIPALMAPHRRGICYMNEWTSFQVLKRIRNMGMVRVDVGKYVKEEGRLKCVRFFKDSNHPDLIGAYFNLK